MTVLITEHYNIIILIYSDQLASPLEPHAKFLQNSVETIINTIEIPLKS